jgi:hypothetical protein
MIQSGGGDWIINSLPSGIESQTPYGALTQDRISVLKRQKTFYKKLLLNTTQLAGWMKTGSPKANKHDISWA